MGKRIAKGEVGPAPRYPRLRALRETLVLQRAAGRFGIGSITNISVGGAFVATPMVLRPQSRVALSVEVVGLPEPFELEAEVVWHNHRFFPVARELPAGYGVGFITHSEQDAENVRRLVREVSWALEEFT